MFDRSFFRNLLPVTKNLLIINIIVWAFMAITPSSTSNLLTDLGGLHYFTSPSFGFWQLFTYMFIHANFVHLFFNMWALLMFGNAIEQRLGSKRFLFYYISCGVGAAIVQLIVFAIAIPHVASQLSPVEYKTVMEQGWEVMQRGMNYTNSGMAELNALINGATVGASGAVFGILLAVGMFYPNNTMYLMFVPYPIKAKWIVIGYGILELAMGIGAPADGIAHFAHLGGMLFGFIMIWFWRRRTPMLY